MKQGAEGTRKSGMGPALKFWGREPRPARWARGGVALGKSRVMELISSARTEGRTLIAGSWPIASGCARREACLPTPARRGTHARRPRAPGHAAAVRAGGREHGDALAFAGRADDPGARTRARGLPCKTERPEGDRP